MSLPKSLFFCALVLFGSIGCVALWKKRHPTSQNDQADQNSQIALIAPTLSSASSGAAAPPVRISLDDSIEALPNEEKPQQLPKLQERQPLLKQPARTPAPQNPLPATSALAAPPPSLSMQPERPVPEADNMNRFFMLDSKQFPIVETIAYKAQVPWVTGRPAWIADYAAHFHTSRHFIARSLNGKADYITQNVVEGNRFNVLRSDKNIAFYLVVDLFRCKMWFYYADLDAKEKVLVKSYSVGLGRWDPSTGSGLLTPLGTYKLGDRTGVYTTKSRGIYKGQDVTMASIFGTRWLPFEQEISGCTAPAKGLGIHGCPWVASSQGGQLIEDTSGINHHSSDGCIRLAIADVEELFAVIVSRPTTVILVGDFFDAEVPGVERTSFTLPSNGFSQEQELPHARS